MILAALLIVIFVWGDTKLITLAGFALVISMLPFYLRLFPAMKKIDQNNQVNPKGFSMRLGFTITALIAALLLGSVLALFEIG